MLHLPTVIRLHILVHGHRNQNPRQAQKPRILLCFDTILGSDYHVGDNGNKQGMSKLSWAGQDLLLE